MFITETVTLTLLRLVIMPAAEQVLMFQEPDIFFFQYRSVTYS